MCHPLTCVEKHWHVLIFISSFVVQFLSMGAPFSIGVYNVEFLKYFGGSRSTTSWIFSINISFLLGAGPIVAYMLRFFSHRQVVIAGICISTVAFVACYFANSIHTLCILYGVIGGFGLAMMYLPATVLVGYYYTEYRSIMTALSTTGGWLGLMVLPKVFTAAIELYTWRGSMLILAGMTFQTMVFAALLREPNQLSCKSYSIEVSPVLAQKEAGFVVGNRGNVDMDGLEFNFDDISDGGGLCSVDGSVYDRGTLDANNIQLSDCVSQDSCRCNNNEKYAEIELKEKSLNKLGNDKSDKRSTDKRSMDKRSTDKRSTDKRSTDKRSTDKRSTDKQSPDICNGVVTNNENFDGEIISTESDPTNIETLNNRRCNEITDENDINNVVVLTNISANASKYDAHENSDTDPPKYSDTLLQQKPHDVSVNDTKSNEEDPIISDNRTKSVMTDMKAIICDFGMNVYIWSNIFWNTGTVMAAVFMTDYVINTCGVTLDEAGNVITATGAGGIVGAVIAGALGNSKHISVVCVYSVLCVVVGVISFLFVVSADYRVIVALNVMYGATFGGIVSVLLVVTATLINDMRLLGLSFGYLMIPNGIGNLMGPPIGGYLFDVSGGYKWTFIVAGTVNVISGLIMVLIPLNKWLRPSPSHQRAKTPGKVGKSF